MNTTEQATAPADWSSIRIAGADRVAFLQGQLTHDVSQLTADTGLLAGWCSPQGRLLCVCWLLDWQDAIWLLLPAELVDPVSQRLRMFVLRADVTVTANALPVTPIKRSQLPASLDKEVELDSINYCLYSDKLAALLPNLTPEIGLLLGDRATLEPATAAWQQALVAAGLPVVQTATREEFVPQMLNLDLLNGISFRKGCYVGQEIVARTHNLGRIKRRMYGFSYGGTTLPEAGLAVLAAGKTVGMVVAAAAGETGMLLTAVIRIESLNEALYLQGDETNCLQQRQLSYPVPQNLDGKPD